jgi:hypothetical protein
MPTLDDLHLAMGEFLTESAQVENMMLSLVIACQPNRDMHDVFVEFMGKTFGGKIDSFKAACRTHPFSDTHRTTLLEVNEDLDKLLSKRNFIVHGTTYQMGKGDIPVQPYRIGMTRGDRDSMNQVLEQDFNVPHVFTTDKIKSTTAEFVAVRATLGAVVIEVWKAFAEKPGSEKTVRIIGEGA